MAIVAEEEDSFSSMLTRGIKELNERGLISTITNDNIPFGLTRDPRVRKVDPRGGGGGGGAGGAACSSVG